MPFIARWPGRVASGTSSAHTLCLTDLLATAADILDAKLPDNAGEDSFSILPVLLDKQPAVPLRKVTFIQGDTADNAIAVRSGSWKLIETGNGRDRKVHRLFDLSVDPGETNDIAQGKPEIVKQLAADLDKARADGRTRPRL